MRDIKFRAWDKKNKQMMSEVCVSVQNSDWNVYLNDYLSSPINGDDGKPLILMQFTGLLDKNGKEIYEGDLIQLIKEDGCVYHAGTVFPVIWNEVKGMYEPDFAHGIPNNRYEVIGNIYENPSLINE